MNEYLTAKQTINKLKQGRVCNISEAYFSQMVRDGFIPHHTLPGKKRKMYLYDEVKQALKDSQDPSRDSQREAIARQKIEKKTQEELIKKSKELKAQYLSARGLLKLKVSDIQKKLDLDDDLVIEIEKEKRDAEQWNWPLMFLFKEQEKLIEELPFQTEHKNLIRYEVLKLTIKMMTTTEDLYEAIEEIKGDMK